MPREEEEIRLSQSGRTTSGFCKIVLNRHQLLSLREIGIKRLSQEGERLISIGSTLYNVSILDSGFAEILAPDMGGQLQTVRAVAPGEILGLTETLAGAQCDFSVSSITECVFTEIPREELIRFLRTAPDTCFELVSMMAAAFIECMHGASA